MLIVLEDTQSKTSAEIVLEDNETLSLKVLRTQFENATNIAIKNPESGRLIL